MAIVKFNRKEFEKHLKVTKEIEEKIPMFGTPLESISDKEIEIEVFPNRPDLLSMHGFLRGFLGFLGKKSNLGKYKIEKSGERLMVDNSLPKEWPYAVACIVKGLKFDDDKIKEVIDIQEKLGMTLLRNRKKGGIGIYPLEKIEFPVRFIGMKPNDIKFVPLESRAEMTGKQILSAHPTGREYADICRNWDKFPVFVDKTNKIMSMPPIINSHLMGKVDQNTKEVFVEATGPDLNIIKKALNIIVTALEDMGGKIYSIECVQQNAKKSDIPDLTPEVMKLDLDNVNKLLGLELTSKNIYNCLTKMGHSCKGNEIKIPAWRTDILHENDLIEDIAIAYGYDKFKPEIPNISFTGAEDIKEVRKRKVSEILVGLGLLETSSYHLTTVYDQFKNVNQKKEDIIEVKESKTEYKILRQNLLHYALKILSENTDSEYPQKIFELGKVFEIDKEEETGIKEIERLSIALADAKTNFTEIKQVLDFLMISLEKEYKLETAENPFFISGRCGKIIVDGKEIGYLGEIQPTILNNLKLKMPISALELDIEKLIE